MRPEKPSVLQIHCNDVTAGKQLPAYFSGQQVNAPFGDERCTVWKEVLVVHAPADAINILCPANVSCFRIKADDLSVTGPSHGKCVAGQGDHGAIRRRHDVEVGHLVAVTIDNGG